MKIKLKTGFGYVKKNGRVIEKFEFSPGEHDFPDDVEVVEVFSKEELDTIKVDHEIIEEPLELKLRRLREEIIDKWIVGEDVSELKSLYMKLRKKFLGGA